jgi:hypothetical protein
MNLSDSGDGMVSLNNNQSTNFVPNNPPEKNVSENKQTMDSTSISDIMGQAEDPMEPPMMSQDPRMTQMQMQTPMMMAQQPIQQQTQEKKPESKNPFNLTDDQFEALIVAACAAVAISKPVQEKLANFVPIVFERPRTPKCRGFSIDRFGRGDCLLHCEKICLI